MTYNKYATIYLCNHKNACQALILPRVTIGETMTTNDIKQLAATIANATPSEAARMWINIASNKSLAIQVHENLTKEQRKSLATKLLKAENGENPKGNKNNNLI
jgi:hypothetical protein